MPFQIQRRPWGPDDTLGAKSWPTFPSQMADQLQMVYDATDDYRATQLGMVAQTVSAAAAGAGGTLTFSSLTVPSNEYWWIDYFSVKGQIAGASSIQWLRPLISHNVQGTTGQLICPDQSPTINTANAEENAVGWTVRAWFPPGAYCAVMTGIITAGGGNPNITGMVRRMAYRA